MIFEIFIKYINVAIILPLQGRQLKLPITDPIHSSMRGEGVINSYKIACVGGLFWLVTSIDGYQYE